VIKATLWDFGGVISTSPFDAFAAYEREQGLPDGFLRKVNATSAETNAWAHFERAQITFDEFCLRFEAEARAAGGTVDARAVTALLRGDIRPAMVEAVRRCHERLQTGLITNNFVSEERGEDFVEVLSHFDMILESSLAGVRKPDPRVYRLACDRLGIEPSEAVFLDDLGVNLKPARAMGMTTIKVTDPDAALAELETVVGFPLRRAPEPE
jgi:putative hydrolase of the HAD superfamily